MPVAPAVTPAVALAPDDPLAVMLIVPNLPPPPKAESPGERPDPARVWVPGYWTWCGDGYEWVAGTWEVPPSPAAAWVSPCWVREGEGFRCFTGHWR
ncbi:MAG: YXWGXW repeat-containing protein [Verrucomicrobia bacterium]|nr:YXWGXW repeat-containing protein [Verrucomicrobiota bacterium]